VEQGGFAVLRAGAGFAELSRPNSLRVENGARVTPWKHARAKRAPPGGFPLSAAIATPLCNLLEIYFLKVKLNPVSPLRIQLPLTDF
jgi:hypothetical protein